LFGTFYGVVFTIYTIYVLTAAEAYGLFSREVKFNFNYIQKVLVLGLVWGPGAGPGPVPVWFLGVVVMSSCSWGLGVLGPET
jgi:hypothetical protein